ncbi:MAG: hypothetical protein P8X82_19450 [Gemmatimonadales bacterium]
MSRTKSRLVAAFVLATGLSTVASQARAQDPRLEGRVPEATRVQIEAVLDSARTRELPTEPLVDRALEGASKGAPPELILSAVIRLADEMAAASDAMGQASSASEVIAGASALRAGARPDDLAYLREVRGDQPLTVAAAVMADLVAVGVPADTAVAAVIGASPVTALGVRLEGAVDALADSPLPQRPRGPRKP